MQEIAIVQRLQTEELEFQIALGLQGGGDLAHIETGEFGIEQFGCNSGLHVFRKIFGVSLCHVGLRGTCRGPVHVGQYLAAKLVQQKPRADIGVVRLLLHQRSRRHDQGQRQFVLADAVVEVAARFGQHGGGGDAIESGAGLVDDEFEPLVVQPDPRSVGQGDMQRRMGFRRRLRSGFLRTFAGAVLAIEHVGTRDLVILTAHQRQFDLVLNILDMERAALAGATRQCRHHIGGQLLDALMHASRCTGRVSFHSEKRLRHRDRDLPQIERGNLAIATDDLHGGLARNTGERLRTQLDDRSGSRLRLLQVQRHWMAP